MIEDSRNFERISKSLAILIVEVRNLRQTMQCLIDSNDKIRECVPRDAEPSLLTREEIEDLVESYDREPELTAEEEALVESLRPYFDPIRDKVGPDEPLYLLQRNTAPASIVISPTVFDWIDLRAWPRICEIYKEFSGGRMFESQTEDRGRILSPRAIDL